MILLLLGLAFKQDIAHSDYRNGRRGEFDTGHGDERMSMDLHTLVQTVFVFFQMVLRDLIELAWA